jgi:hypothetical protein
MSHGKGINEPPPKNTAQQNAGEGPGLLRGLPEVPGSGKVKVKLLLELFGFRSLAPQLPVRCQQTVQFSIDLIPNSGTIEL